MGNTNSVHNSAQKSGEGSALSYRSFPFGFMELVNQSKFKILCVIYALLISDLFIFINPVYGIAHMFFPTLPVHSLTVSYQIVILGNYFYAYSAWHIAL